MVEIEDDRKLYVCPPPPTPPCSRSLSLSLVPLHYGLHHTHETLLLLVVVVCVRRYVFSAVLYDRRIAQEVPGDELGEEFKGYVFKITGGCDKQGFPMKQGVLVPHRVRLLLGKRMYHTTFSINHLRHRHHYPLA